MLLASIHWNWTKALEVPYPSQTTDLIAAHTVPESVNGYQAPRRAQTILVL